MEYVERLNSTYARFSSDATVPGDLKYQPGALTIYMGKPEIPVRKLNGFPSLQSVLQAFPAPVR